MLLAKIGHRAVLGDNNSAESVPSSPIEPLSEPAPPGVTPRRGQNTVRGAAHRGWGPSHRPGYAPLEAARERVEAIWGVPAPATPGLDAALAEEIRSGPAAMGSVPAAIAAQVDHHIGRRAQRSSRLAAGHRRRRRAAPT